VEKGGGGGEERGEKGAPVFFFQGRRKRENVRKKEKRGEGGKQGLTPSYVPPLDLWPTSVPKKERKEEKKRGGKKGQKGPRLLEKPRSPNRGKEREKKGKQGGEKATGPLPQLDALLNQCPHEGRKSEGKERRGQKKGGGFPFVYRYSRKGEGGKGGKEKRTRRGIMSFLLSRPKEKVVSLPLVKKK